MTNHPIAESSIIEKALKNSSCKTIRGNLCSETHAYKIFNSITQV